MGVTNTDRYNKRQNTLALWTKALGHPARIAIVEFLLSTEKCICGDIVNFLPLAQPTVSQHLKELRNAGIIEGNIEGNAICYYLNAETFDKIQQFFGDFNSRLSIKNNTCC